MITEVKLVGGAAWQVTEFPSDDDSAATTYLLTCEIRTITGERGPLNSPRSAQTCGAPALWRAITGAADLSGQSYDERLCCAACKAADEASGKYFVDGVLVEDYGPAYEYELITEGWLLET